jgi:hypothetical protein
VARENITELELFNAIERIINKATVRIPSSRKLSVRSVEDEAGLGDGSAYYYEDVITKVKSLALKEKQKGSNGHSITDLKLLKDRLKKEINTKDKYREKISLLDNRLKLMAKEHNELFQQMIMYKEKAEDLENKILLGDKKGL